MSESDWSLISEQSDKKYKNMENVQKFIEDNADDFQLLVTDVNETDYDIEILYNSRTYKKTITKEIIDSLQPIFKIYPTILKTVLQKNASNKNFFKLKEYINEDINGHLINVQEPNKLEIDFSIKNEMFEESILLIFTELPKPKIESKVNMHHKIIQMEETIKKLHKRLEITENLLRSEEKKDASGNMCKNKLFIAYLIKKFNKDIPNDLIVKFGNTDNFNYDELITMLSKKQNKLSNIFIHEQYFNWMSINGFHVIYFDIYNTYLQYDINDIDKDFLRTIDIKNYQNQNFVNIITNCIRFQGAIKYINNPLMNPSNYEIQLEDNKTHINVHLLKNKEIIYTATIYNGMKIENGILTYDHRRI